MNFDNTRQALVEFDAGKEQREQMFHAVDSNADVAAWEAAEKAALDKVRVAFYEDTKDINNLPNCMLVDENFMRRMTNLKESER